MAEEDLKKTSSCVAKSPSQKGGAKGSSFVWGCLLLSMLGLVVLAGFQWQSFQQMAAIRQENEAAKVRLASFASEAEGAHQSVQQELHQLDEQLSKLEQVPETLGVVQTRLAKFVASHQWELAEVQYLIHIGFERLQVFGDIPTAILQYQEADKRLYRMGDPTFHAVREALAQDIAALQAVSVPDKSGVWAKIGAIKAALTELVVNVESVEALQAEHLADAESPTDKEAEAEAGLGSPTEKDKSRWKKALNNTWRELKGLVKVRHHEGGVSVPLLSQQEQDQIQRTFVLFLEQARWAVVAGDQMVYEDSLKNALEWLTTYFEQNVATQSVVSHFEALLSLQVQVDIPDASLSVQAIDNALKNSVTKSRNREAS